MSKLIAAIGALAALAFASPVAKAKPQTSSMTVQVALGHLGSYHGNMFVAYDPTQSTPEEPCPPTFAIKAESMSPQSHCHTEATFTVGNVKNAKLKCDSSSPEIPRYVLDWSGARAWECVANATRPVTCAEGGSFLHQTYSCNVSEDVTGDELPVPDWTLRWIRKMWHGIAAELFLGANSDLR